MFFDARNIRSFYTIFYDLDSSCLDAIGLFALLRLLTRIFGLTAIFMVPLLVPLNYVHRQSDSSIHGLDKFSCLNILEGNTGRLWTHLVATYWFTGLFCLLSRRELAKFVDIRHMHDSGTASRCSISYMRVKSDYIPRETTRHHSSMDNRTFER